ncbi:hypothetical protein [Shivajiella indica]|uniref:Uncharacterized protein n=1 Tax=Shivajiella indica TaxID=872115 RepID=A0ABW5B6Z1_9BACT
MYTDVLLPNTKLSSFVSGYFLVNAEDENHEIVVKTYESGVSLAVPLGKPFEFFVGKSHLEEEEVTFKSFDKPYLFWDAKSVECFSVKGDARIVFIVLTEQGLQLLLNEKNPNYDEPVFPISRLGVPIFNLVVKRKLRFNQDDQAGLQIIEEELLRFFKKFEMDESHQSEIDLDTDFPFIP